MAKILGVHVPAEIKNLAINGAFDFWQRVEGNTVTVSSSTGSGYTTDMATYAVGGTARSFTVARSTNVPSIAQSGFASTYSYLFTSTVGLASLATNDFYEPFQYRMEGFDFQKIHQKTATFSFWFNPSVAGTYSFALVNGTNNNRTYMTTFAASVGWQFITITVAMDLAGTWALDNSQALSVVIGALSGTGQQTSTLNAWQTGSFLMASNATNWAATTGATLQIAQFSIVEGPLGFAATGFQRAGKDIQQELAMCQRYYEKSFPNGVAPGAVSLTGCFRCFANDSQTMQGGGMAWFQTRKRSVTYSVQFYSSNTGAAGKWYDNNNSSDTTITFSNFNCGDNFVCIEGNAGLTTGHFYTVNWIVDCGL